MPVTRRSLTQRLSGVAHWPVADSLESHIRAAGDAALRATATVRREVAALTVPHEDTTIRLTCSLGVAELTPDMADLDTLLRHADEALYQAKSQGRDRVVQHRATTA